MFHHHHHHLLSLILYAAEISLIAFLLWNLPAAWREAFPKKRS
jgi:hypothetical protein